MINFIKKTYNNKQKTSFLVQNRLHKHNPNVYYNIILIVCLCFFQKDLLGQHIFLENDVQNKIYFKDKTLQNDIWQTHNSSIFLQKDIFENLFQKPNMHENIYFLDIPFSFEEKIAKVQRTSYTENQLFLADFYENILKNSFSDENWGFYLKNQALEYQKNNQYASSIHYWKKLKYFLDNSFPQKNIMAKDEVEKHIFKNYLMQGNYDTFYQYLEESNFSNLEKGNYAYLLGKKDTQNIAYHWKKAEDFFIVFLTQNHHPNHLKNKEALARLCEIYYEHCDFDKIILLTKDFLNNNFIKNQKKSENLDILDFQILQKTSEALFHKKYYKEAVLHYEIWKKLSETNEQQIKFSQEALFHYGWALFQTEKWAESCAILEKIGFLQIAQSDIAFFYAGQSYTKLEMPKQAQEAYAQANRITKNEELKKQTYVLLAKTATQNKNYREAAQYWQTYKKNYPQEALSENVDYFIQKNQLQGLGFKNFSKNLDSLNLHNTQIGQFYVQLALEKSLEQTENQQTKEENEQIIQELLQNKNLSLHQQRNLKHTLAERYLQNQKPLLAIPLYQELLDWKAKNDDFSLLSHYGLGYGYYQTGQFMLANTHFQLCIVANSPNFSEYLKNDAFVRLADGYFALNDLPKAKKYYEYALKIGERFIEKSTKEYIESQISNCGQ